MATDKPKPTQRRLKARRTTGRSAGISQSAFAGYGHQQPAPPNTTSKAEQPADKPTSAAPPPGQAASKTGDDKKNSAS